MKAWAVHALLAACLVAVSLIGYDRMVLRPALVVGVVDLSEVYRSKEAEFTGLLTGAIETDVYLKPRTGIE